MDPLVITIGFGLGIALIQLLIALKLMHSQRRVPLSRLIRKRSIQEINREAVRSGTATADDVLSSKVFQKDLKVSYPTKLLRAGYENPKKQRRFFIVSAFMSLLLGVFVAYVFRNSGTFGVITFGIFGVFLGSLISQSWLDRRIASREMQIIKDLPLVLDQLQINLSGALELVPAIDLYLSTLKQRETFNLAAFHFEKVMVLIGAGLSPSEAFKEAGESSGHHIIQHIFLFLSNCQDFGTGISDQLLSLNEQATQLYRISIEEKIIRLPVAATMPLALVFAGFFAMTSSGIVNKLLNAFPLDR